MQAKNVIFRVLLLKTLVLLSASACGSEIDVPLRLDYLFLRRLLLEQIYTDQDNTAQVLDDRQECSSLVLWDPQIEKEGEIVRIVTKGDARLGVRFAGDCWYIPQWKGLIEVFEEPSLVPGQPKIEFQVVDSNLLDRKGEKPLVSGTLWDWAKNFVHPRLALLKVDLNPALQELKALVPLMLSRAGTEAARHAIESVKLSGLQVSETSIVINLELNISELAGQAEPSGPEPVLSVEEALRWEASWQRWDAFLTFVVKQVAKDTESEDLRQALQDVLLDGRYDLTNALVEWKKGMPDPVRGLFLKTWERLSPVLQQLETTLPGAAAIRYLSFITAADALKAMDQVGEKIGFEISADGLRRMARMLAPESTEDPLIYDLDVDPELRRLFNFGSPLSLPRQLIEMHTSEWFFFTPAWAADEGLVEKLNRWVPEKDEIEGYLLLVNNLLNDVSKNTIRSKGLASEYHPFFRLLTLATAWQESCWRQYVKKNGRIKPLTSPTGAVGIMQVNPHVWRGFYDIAALRSDIAYNAHAGNEILQHYLVDYVIARVKHKSDLSFEGLARLTYLVYNGGPSRLARYLKQSAAKTTHHIAGVFLNKYKAIKKNGAKAVSGCFVVPE